MILRVIIDILPYYLLLGTKIQNIPKIGTENHKIMDKIGTETQNQHRES